MRCNLRPVLTADLIEEILFMSIVGSYINIRVSFAVEITEISVNRNIVTSTPSAFFVEIPLCSHPVW
jgi:hypothetical protein